MSTTELQTIPPSGNVTPHDLLRIAIEGGADLDRLEKLMDLQDRYDANQARKAFTEDMTEFKKAAPEIVKRNQVSFGSGDKKTEYKHAKLFDVCDAIVSSLANHGFTHRWKTEQLDGGQIVVTCVITHRLGHSEETALRSGADQSGGKNNIQAVASTLSYLQRYSLLSAVGLATKDMDDDGRGAGVEYINEDQGKEVNRLIGEAGEHIRAPFLKYMGGKEPLPTVMHILAKDYDKAVKKLKEKVAEKKA